MSAFYAECPSKRFYVNGTVGTKTKFLGLSVKAQNNGTGIMFTIYYQSLVAHGRNLFRDRLSPRGFLIVAHVFGHLGGGAST